MVDRILRNTAPIVQGTFSVDGTPTNAGTVTAKITREDGTVLRSGASTTSSATGVYDLPLLSTETAALDVLAIDWTGTIGGQPQTVRTYVELVGGYLFPMADARALTPLDNTTKYPSATVLAARTLAEDALEWACGVPFVPRYFRDKFDGTGDTDLFLARFPRPLSIDSATIDGVAADLTSLELYPEGWAYLPNGWTQGRRNVVLKGSYGWQAPPPRVGRACLLLAKRILVDTPISDRVTSISSQVDGSTQFFVTAGVRDAVFDVPECNAVVAQYGVRGPLG